MSLTAILFAAVTGFAILLSSETLYDFSRETRLSAFQGLGEQLRFSIERGLRFGRPLDGYAGLQEQLENVIGLADGSVGVIVADALGNSLYSAGSGGIHDRPETLPEDPRHVPGGGEAVGGWTETGSGHVLLMPIHGRERMRAGSLLLVVDGTGIRQEYHGHIRRSVLLALILTGIIVLIQSGWAAKLFRSGDERTRRRSLYLMLVVFVGGGQIAFSIPSAFFFHAALTASEMAKAETVGRMLSQDLERLIHKGLRLEQVHGIAAHLDGIRANTPEIAAMRLTGGGVTLAGSGAAPDGGDVAALPVHLYWPDRHTPRKSVARLEIWTDPGPVNAALKRICLNQLTVMVVSLLLLMELSRMLTTVGFASTPVRGTAADEESSVERHVAVIRILAFLFFFGYDMVLSFVPLTARTLPGSIWSMGGAQLAALPITAEAVAGGAGILLAARVGRRLGMRPALFSGMGFAMAGMIAAGMADHIGVFILARGLAGIGFGLVFMLCQIALVERQARADGLAQMYSGLFAGSLCGVATGAMASELVGYQNVFVFSTILFALALPLAAIVPPTLRKGAAGTTGGKSLAGTVRFFLSAEFVLPVALATLPVAASLAGFIYFGMPVELNRQGVAQGDIGRLFMAYGLCFILLGPLFARLADRTGRYLAWVSLSGLVNGAALLSAWLHPHPGGFALAALLAGVANCLLASSAMVHIVRGRRARLQERETVGSVYRMVERCGHMAGPLIFSLILSLRNPGAGIFWLGLTFCFAAVILFLVRRPAESL